jgi:hypothetical protein
MNGNRSLPHDGTGPYRLSDIRLASKADIGRSDYDYVFRPAKTTMMVL